MLHIQSNPNFVHGDQRVRKPNTELSGSALIAFRWRVVQELLETGQRTRERGVELHRAARKWGVSVRSLQRWLAAHDAAGGDINSFLRKRTSSAGTRRVWVSRRFDRAFLHAHRRNAELLPKIAAEVDRLICAAWASPAQRAGWRQVRREVLSTLTKTLREKKIELPSIDVSLSQRRIREASHYRIVDVRAYEQCRILIRWEFGRIESKAT